MNAFAQKNYQLKELVKDLDVTIKGDINCLITGVSTIQQATTGHITFLTNVLYKKFLAITKASVVILTEDCVAECPATAIITHNPYFIYSKIAKFFEQSIIIPNGIHVTAVVDPTAIIDKNATIGAHCVIGQHAKIAANVQIGAHCVIGDHVQ